MPCDSIVSMNFNVPVRKCGTESTRTSRETMHSTAPASTDSPVAAKMSTLDRFLPVWIIAAMALGLLLGRLVPGLAEALDSVKVADVSLPIAIGLLVMMFPVLAKVRYDETGKVLADKKLMITSLVINWAAAPAFMFALAWLDRKSTRLNSSH